MLDNDCDTPTIRRASQIHPFMSNWCFIKEKEPRCLILTITFEFTKFLFNSPLISCPVNILNTLNDLLNHYFVLVFKKNIRKTRHILLFDAQFDKVIKKSYSNLKIYFLKQIV